MWSDYFFYFISLPEVERNQQILLMLSFWGIMIFIGFIIEMIKKKMKK